MKIILTGGTGLIGKVVMQRALAAGHSIVALTRQVRTNTNPHIRYRQWDARHPGAWVEEFTGDYAILHLAGEGIFDHRWTPTVKERLMQSRVESTRLITEVVRTAPNTPVVLVSASAVGYYGDRHDAPTDEHAPHGSDFLSEICVRWEEQAFAAEAFGVRVAVPRIGIVLSKEGGALGRMLPAFQAFVGMPLGSGKQWFPWVHIHDAARALLFPLESSSFSGAYNLAAPAPVQMSEFCTALGKTLRRPAWSWMSVPEFALRLGLGEAAAALTGGQRIQPKKLMEAGFVFQFTDVGQALSDLLPTKN
jgi:uncharacterized protein